MTERRTDRLLLRQWRDDDLDALAAIDADPEVMRWIGDGSVRDRAQTLMALARFAAAWSNRGYGPFAAEADGVLIGWVGLLVPTFLPEIMPAVEIGWRLARGAWGRGLATEGARAVLAFAFDDAGLDRVVSVCHVENTASERVMTKLGMHLDRDTVVPASGVPVHVYAIDRAVQT
ncbi:GNAT family N-acetyltransferase [Cellulomonas sp. McL0617]|uniref:GNAT family N-acetyltransferase n=1 Tax=Cellulomonas sp. McL0617 TaxID=3415675 RepID=UPI003CE77722